jgi:hypothetical protein
LRRAICLAVLGACLVVPAETNAAEPDRVSPAALEKFKTVPIYAWMVMEWKTRKAIGDTIGEAYDLKPSQMKLWHTCVEGASLSKDTENIPFGKVAAYCLQFAIAPPDLPKSP